MLQRSTSSQPEIDMTDMPSSIRVGTGAGFSDDRFEPAADMAEHIGGQVMDDLAREPLCLGFHGR